MNTTTWTAIEEGFSRWPASKAEAIEAAEFDQAMVSYGTIDADYREFVLRYGGGILGARPIFGLRKAELMGTIGGNWTAPQITHWFKSRQWLGTKDWLIFSVDHGGNPIGFANDGTVWISDQMDFQQIVQLANGFEDYVLKWCLKLKSVD